MSNGFLLAVCIINILFSVFLLFFAIFMLVTMRGNRVDLKEVVLVQQEELPENVALRCGESLDDSSDDEGDLQEVEREQVQQVPTPRKDLYLVETACGICKSQVVFVCKASQSGIRNLQSSLVDEDLEFSCYNCLHGITGQ